jgi:hypothetical protein
MKSSFTLFLSVMLTAPVLGACKDHGGGPIPVAPVAEEKDFGKDTQGSALTPNGAPPTPITAELIFSTRCSTCHGTTGHGDGPAAQALNPKPRNYTDPAWQKSVTDEQIKKTIVEGGAAVGKSPLMVPNPDLADKPVVVDGLVKIIRGFSSDAAAAAPSTGAPK